MNPTLWISPQKRLVATGSSVIVEVKITEATFSYGLNCQIEYDPQMLEIDEESVIEGEFYRQDGAPTSFLRKIVRNPKNGNKVLVVGVSRYNDRNNSYGPVAGDGLVFYFVAKAQFVGEAALSFKSVDMINLRYQQEKPLWKRSH
ncbi:MAG: cohesin domain-containing protein [Caldisericia bacterium]